jgi:hypothetical protein
VLSHKASRAQKARREREREAAERDRQLKIAALKRNPEFMAVAEELGYAEDEGALALAAAWHDPIERIRVYAAARAPRAEANNKPEPVSFDALPAPKPPAIEVTPVPQRPAWETQRAPTPPSRPAWETQAPRSPTPPAPAKAPWTPDSESVPPVPVPPVPRPKIVSPVRQATGEILPPAAMGDRLTKLIDQFNTQYAVVNEAGIAVIYEPTVDPVLNRKVLARITFENFKKFYQNYKITIQTPNGPLTKTAAEWWLNHALRRQYLGGVVFDPTGAERLGCRNLWSGFSVDPAKGDWSLMLAHIERVICGGDGKHFEYLLNWIARMFQQPNRPGEVAVVLRGKKGVGKGILFTWLCRAWGQHGLHISNAKHLVGNFNAHLRDAVFLFADEAFFAADKQHESVLKALITEPTLPIEGKYQNLVQVQNMLHVGMASNDDWVVPASADERRFFVRDVADNRIGDRPYFAAIFGQMEEGGLAAMIHDMLHREISRFEVRDVPDSAALADQKQHSLDTLDRWWSDCLSRGFIYRARFGATAFAAWPEFATTELLHSSYRQWCTENRISRPQNRVQLGKRMKAMYSPARPTPMEIIGEVESLTTAPADRIGDWLNRDTVIMAENKTGYFIETLDEARAAFTDQRGVTGEWGVNDWPTGRPGAKTG